MTVQFQYKGPQRDLPGAPFDKVTSDACIRFSLSVVKKKFFNISFKGFFHEICFFSQNYDSFDASSEELSAWLEEVFYRALEVFFKEEKSKNTLTRSKEDDVIYAILQTLTQISEGRPIEEAIGDSLQKYFNTSFGLSFTPLDIIRAYAHGYSPEVAAFFSGILPEACMIAEQVTSSKDKAYKENPRYWFTYCESTKDFMPSRGFADLGASFDDVLNAEGYLEISGAVFKVFLFELSEGPKLYLITPEIRFSSEDKAAEEHMGIITSSLAHELINPLSGILAGLQVLKIDQNADHEIMELEESAKRALSLVKLFLGIGRVRMPDEESIPLVDVFTQSMRLVQALALEEQILLSYNIESTDGPLFVNPRELRLLFYLLAHELLKERQYAGLVQERPQSLEISLRCEGQSAQLLADGIDPRSFGPFLHYLTHHIPWPKAHRGRIDFHFGPKERECHLQALESSPSAVR